MLTPEETNRLENLLAELREETLDAEGLQELERLVLKDAQSLERYVDTTQLRNSLAWGVEQGEEPGLDKARPSAVPPLLGFLGDFRDQATTLFFSGPYSLFAAALTLGSLLTVLAFIAAPMAWGFFRGPDDPREVVARLERTVECLWADDDSRIPVGTPIRQGHEIRLRAGLAEVEFRDGTHVILEGPVSLKPDSIDSATLRYGRITAKSPHRPTRFTVNTPSTQVVDLGTEFGVHVDVTGASTVAVFDGSVQIEHRNPPSQRRYETLLAGERVCITPAKHLMGHSVASDRFIRELPQKTRLNTLAKIDITPDASLPLQPGFSPFVVGEDEIPAGEMIEESFGKITVSLRGVDVALKPRYRSMLEDNEAFDQVPLLADLLFAAEGEPGLTGMDIIIRDLVPGRRHMITIWSSDVSSEGTRVSDWFANDTRVNNDYAFTYEVLPKNNLDRQFQFTASADARGEIHIKARRDATSFISENGPQPAVFLNGIQIQELEPIVETTKNPL